MERAIRLGGVALALAVIAAGFVPVAYVGGVAATVQGYRDTGPVYVYVDPLMRARYCYAAALLAAGALLVSSLKWRSVDAQLLLSATATAALLSMQHYVSLADGKLVGSADGWVVVTTATPAIGQTVLDAAVYYAVFYTVVVAGYAVIRRV